MPSFRTTSVFRFTNDFDLLKRIIRDGIIPNYCEEDLSFDSQEFYVGIPMACFCDIPITLLDEHNKRYGNYGVALSKEWALEKGLSPVMYVANPDVLRSVYYHFRQNQMLIDELQRGRHKRRTVKGSSVENSFMILLDQFDRSYKLYSAKQEHAINTHIIGYLKKYQGEYRNKPINNYEENEWRFLVPDVDGTEWYWSKDSYRSWRFPKKNFKAAKPSPSEALRRYTLKFSYDDISYLLVKDNVFKARLIEYIKTLNKIGGNETIKGDQIDDLISKIITLEQVKRDF